MRLERTGAVEAEGDQQGTMTGGSPFGGVPLQRRHRRGTPLVRRAPTVVAPGRLLSAVY